MDMQQKMVQHRTLGVGVRRRIRRHLDGFDGVVEIALNIFIAQFPKVVEDLGDSAAFLDGLEAGSFD